MPPGMDRAAIDLATSIQDTMVALFNLQTALINYFFSRSSNGLVEAFQHIRSELRADWENYILFFQGCQGYGEDYISLCQYSITRKPAETLAFARDVLAMARNLSKEVTMLRVKHEKALSEVNIQTKKLPSLFRKPPIPGNIRMCLVLFGHKIPSDLDIDRANAGIQRTTRGASLADFIQMSDATLRPNGAQALKDSKDALELMGTSLRDLDIFWKDQVQQLSAVARTEFPSRDHISQSSDMWRNTQSVMQRVVSSISASSDAVQVDPVGATKKYPHRKQGFWERFFGFFFR